MERGSRCVHVAQSGDMSPQRRPRTQTLDCGGTTPLWLHASITMMPLEVRRVLDIPSVHPKRDMYIAKHVRCSALQKLFLATDLVTSFACLWGCVPAKMGPERT